MHPLQAVYPSTGSESSPDTQLCSCCDRLILVGYQVPSSAGQRRENKARFLNQDKVRERSLSNCYHGQNRLDLKKLTKFIVNQSRVVRNKTLIKTFPHSSLLRGFNFTPIFFSTSSSFPAAQGGGESRLWSVHCMLFLLLLSPEMRTPHTLPFLQSVVSPTGCPNLAMQTPYKYLSGSAFFITLNFTVFLLKHVKLLYVIRHKKYQPAHLSIHSSLRK